MLGKGVMVSHGDRNEPLAILTLVDYAPDAIPDTPFTALEPIEEVDAITTEEINLDEFDFEKDIQPLLGKGNDLEIARWLIFHERQQDVLQHLQEFTLSSELIRLLIFSTTPDVLFGNSQSITRFQIEGMRDSVLLGIEDRLMDDGLEKFKHVQGEGGVIQVSNYTARLTLYKLNREKSVTLDTFKALVDAGYPQIVLCILYNLNYEKSVCFDALMYAIEAGYSNLIFEKQLTGLTKEQKAQVVKALRASSSWHIIIHYRKILELDMPQVLEILQSDIDLKNQEHALLYSICAAESPTTVNATEFPNMIRSLTEAKALKQVLLIMIHQYPDRVEQVFLLFLRKNDTSYGDATFECAHLLPPECRELFLSQAIEHKHAREAFKKIKDFKLSVASQELLVREAVQKGHGHWVIDCSENLDIPIAQLFEMVMENLDKRAGEELASEFKKFRAVANVQDVALQIGKASGFGPVLSYLKSFEGLNRETLLEQIEQEDRWADLVTSGKMREFTLTKEQEITAYEKATKLPRDYIIAVMELPKSERIFVEYMALCEKEKEKFQELLAVADPEDGYSLSPEALMKIGRNQEIAEAMVSAGIDMEQWNTADPVQKFEVEWKRELTSDLLIDAFESLMSDFDSLLTHQRDRMAQTKKITPLSRKLEDPIKGDSKSIEVIYTRIGTAIGKLKHKAQHIKKEAEAIKKEYASAVKKAEGNDGEGHATDELDRQAENALVAEMKRLEDKSQNFVESMIREVEVMLDRFEDILLRVVALNDVGERKPNQELNYGRYEEIQAHIQNAKDLCREALEELNAPKGSVTHEMSVSFAPKNLTTFLTLGRDFNCCVKLRHLMGYIADIGVRLPIITDHTEGKVAGGSFLWCGAGALPKSTVENNSEKETPEPKSLPDDLTFSVVEDNAEVHPRYSAYYGKELRHHLFTHTNQFAASVGCPLTTIGSVHNDVPMKDLPTLQHEGETITFTKVGSDVWLTEKGGNTLYLETRGKAVHGPLVPDMSEGGTKTTTNETP